MSLGGDCPVGKLGSVQFFEFGNDWQVKAAVDHCLGVCSAIVFVVCAFNFSAVAAPFGMDGIRVHDLVAKLAIRVKHLAGVNAALGRPHFADAGRGVLVNVGSQLFGFVGVEQCGHAARQVFHGVLHRVLGVDGLILV